MREVVTRCFISLRTVNFTSNFALFKIVGNDLLARKFFARYRPKFYISYIHWWYKIISQLNPKDEGVMGTFKTYLQTHIGESFLIGFSPVITLITLALTRTFFNQKAYFKSIFQEKTQTTKMYSKVEIYFYLLYFPYIVANCLQNILKYYNK